MLIINDSTISGARILGREIPAAFMARSSLFSPNPPIVIIEEKSVARGNTSGISVAAPQPRNSAITEKLKPLPTSSSIYSHKNCNRRANVTIINVTTNGPKKDVIIKRSIFFKVLYFVASSVSLAIAAAIPSGFFPPALAKKFCPPPPPLM